MRWPLTTLGTVALICATLAAGYIITHTIELMAWHMVNAGELVK